MLDENKNSNNGKKKIKKRHQERRRRNSSLENDNNADDEDETMNEDDDEEENNNNSSSEEEDTYESDNEDSEDKVAANSQSLLFVDYSIIQYNRVINIVRALYEPHSSSASDQHDDENNKSISGQKTAGHNSSKNELDKVREPNRLDNQMRHSFLIIYISILDNDGQ